MENLQIKRHCRLETCYSLPVIPKNNNQETNMGVAEKSGNALRKLKSAAQKRASSLPASNLINAVVDQVNQFETGIKQTVDGVQDKVKGLQANLLKMYQANKELEQENRELAKTMVGLEKENAHLTMKLDRTQMELDVLKAKLENIGKLVSGYEESIAAVTRSTKTKRK